MNEVPGPSPAAGRPAAGPGRRRSAGTVQGPDMRKAATSPGDRLPAQLLVSCHTPVSGSGLISQLAML
jgi:hypothetical protein